MDKGTSEREKACCIQELWADWQDCSTQCTFWGYLGVRTEYGVRGVAPEASQGQIIKDLIKVRIFSDGL